MSKLQFVLTGHILRSCVAAICVAALATSAASAQVPSYVPKDGLIGWWPFNGNAKDESGNGRNGTVTNASLTQDRLGVQNHAYYMNGTSAFIALPSTSFTNGMSISVWVRQNDFQPNSSSINPRIVSGEWCNGGFALVNLVNDAPKQLLFTLNRGDKAQERTASFTIANNQLEHLCVTYDKSRLKIYRNGELVDDFALTGAVQSSSAQIFLGKSGCEPEPGMHDYFKGMLDDVGMWSRALSQTEVENLYKGLGCNITITSQPQSDTLPRCQQKILEITANSDIAIRYKWQHNPGSGFIDISDGSRYSGAATSKLLVLAMSSQTKGAYRCVVSTAQCTDTSNVAMLALRDIVPSNVPKNGLVGWWPFNCDADDESGNGANGRVSGATLTLNRKGTVNSAYRFSSPGSSPRISATVNTTNVTNGVSVSYWMRRLGDGSMSPRIWEFCPGRPGAAPGALEAYWYNRESYAGVDHVTTTGSSTGPVINTSTGPGLVNGMWYHVVYTNDGLVAKLYLNAKEVDKKTSAGSILLASDFTIGCMGHPAFDAFNGELDDFGLWNRAITSSEVERLYDGQTCNIAVTTHPKSDSLQRCQQTTLSVTATSDTVLTYKWQHNSGNGFIDISDGNRYSGVATSKLTVLAMSSQTKGAYRCVVSTAQCTDTSKVAMLALRDIVPSNVPKNGLVGWWPFNCDADDESGNGHHATSKGASLAPNRQSITNSAYALDGADDHMVVSDSLLDLGWKSYSTAAWVKVDSLPSKASGDGSACTIINTDPHTGLSISANGNGRFGIILGDPASQSWIMGGLYSNTKIAVGTWHHIAVVRDSNRLVMYVDGNRDTALLLNPVSYSSKAQLVFGKCSCYLFEYLKGSLDEIGLWNRALTAAEVKRVYGDVCTGTGGLERIALQSLKLGGDAYYKDSIVTLTQAVGYRTGTAWLPKKYDLSQGFDVRFSFRMRDGADNGEFDGGSLGADGVTFVIQNLAPVVTGGNGAGIGYSGITSGIVVEYDAYQNLNVSDPSTSHLAVQVSDGQNIRPRHIAPYLRGITSAGVPEFVSDGSTYYGRIVLQGDRLSVFCDKTGNLTTPLLTVDSLDLIKLVNLGADGTAYLGFTAGTGSAYQWHELLDLQVQDCGPIVTSVAQELREAEPAVSARIIPTPSRSEASIELSREFSAETTCRIYDIRGEEVATVRIPAGVTRWSLPLAGLGTGTYYIQLPLDGDVVIAPLIVLAP